MYYKRHRVSIEIFLTTGVLLVEKTEKQPLAMHLSARCGAKCKRTGQPCRAPAMPNGRCRMHGGSATGAPIGNTNAETHGYYKKEAIERRQELRAD